MKKYQSNAKWPEGTMNGFDHDVSSDYHTTKKQAQSVCAMLEQDGFGGKGKIFPVQTWICSKSTKTEMMKKVYDRGFALGTEKATILLKEQPIVETHEEITAGVFGIAVNNVTKDQRQYVKQFRFMEMYGAPFLRIKNEI